MKFKETSSVQFCIDIVMVGVAYIDITKYVDKVHRKGDQTQMHPSIYFQLLPWLSLNWGANQQGKTLDSLQISISINTKDPKFVGIEGVEDTNYPLQPPLDDDPFAHLRNEPYFSFNRFIFNDPWFHEDSH